MIKWMSGSNSENAIYKKREIVNFPSVESAVQTIEEKWILSEKCTKHKKEFYNVNNIKNVHPSLVIKKCEVKPKTIFQPSN